MERAGRIDVLMLNPFSGTVPRWFLGVRPYKGTVPLEYGELVRVKELFHWSMGD